MNDTIEEFDTDTTYGGASKANVARNMSFFEYNYNKFK